MDKNDRKLPAEKYPDSKPTSKIKFNLEKQHLQCFMSTKKLPRPSEKIITHIKTPESPKPTQELVISSTHSPAPATKTRSSFDSADSVFSNKLLLMQYGQDEVYIDSTKRKASGLSEDSPKGESSDGENELVASCIKVITEETDNTSNPMSARYSMSSEANPYASFSYQMPNRERNRRAVSREESTIFQINVEEIDRDGRTTLMLRNIPNKYTRDMILDEIDELNFKKKYDFFYLPIDYRNQCNVGYAFINFIHTKFIAQFHHKFHLKKWQKFNSEKICQVCYARIQGTAQLLSHFKDSNVIQQRDKKLRPLIDMNIKHSTLAQMVERQKTMQPERQLDQ